MDRIRLSNGIPYSFVEIEQNCDDLLITFYKTIDPKTINRNFLDVLRVEDRNGKCLSVFKGFDTIIQIIGNTMHLRRYNYTDTQLAQQSITDNELITIESQQDMTDAYIENIESEQEKTDSELENVESEQYVTDTDLEQTEQGQTLTEYELELMETI